jgi:transcriptional regulator with XRE-family HTH domain
MVRMKLRNRRNEYKYTHEQMSSITGIERTKYTRIENGSIKRVSVDDAYLIAKALNTSIEAIFMPNDVYEEHSQPPGGDAA